MKKIFLIDSNNIIYRSFFAIKSISTSTGFPTNAIFGFVSTLIKILREYNPEYIGCVFDTAAPTFRHEILKEYKIDRKPMPPELSAQIPVIKEIIESFGIACIEKESLEADDLIAHIALQFSSQGYQVIIFSSDKDLFQLLSPDIKIINPATWEEMDEKVFFEKFGFPPSKIVDFLALSGDVSDGVPGVKGIGEKTATILIKEFGSIENLYQNIDKIKGKKKELLLSGRDSAFLSKKLVQLKSNLPLELEIEEFKRKQPQFEKISNIFQKLEFKKFLQQIDEISGYKRQEILNDAFVIGDKTFDFNEILASPLSFQSMLEDSSIEKTGRNIKEKIKLLAKKNIYLSPPYFDIEIASFLTGFPSENTDIISQKQNYKKLIESEEMEYLFYSIEMKLIEVLAEMEMHGILVDKNYLEFLKNQYRDEMNKIQDSIYSIAGEVFNINSPSQVAKILFDKLSLPPVKKTKSGYSTDTDSLLQIRNRHKIVDLILQYRELVKLCSTYIEGFSSFINPSDGRIHPEYQQAVVSTGRLACRNPNLQAIPVKTERGGKIRKIFIAPQDALLYSFDYSQIELRILAHFSKDPVLIDAFRSNRDIHLETASQLFSFEDGLFSQPHDIEKYRRIAKTINFGIIYGMNAYGLAQRLSCSPEEAQFFIDTYFTKFRRVREYIQKAIAEAQEKGYVKTLFGRKRNLPEIHSENRNQREFAFRVAINMPIQGTAAELIKLAMIKIHQLKKQKKLKSAMVLQIHDELVFEIYKDESEFAEEIKNIMENIYSIEVPLKVNVERGENYLEMSEI